MDNVVRRMYNALKVNVPSKHVGAVNLFAQGRSSDDLRHRRLLFVKQVKLRLLNKLSYVET